MLPQTRSSSSLSPGLSSLPFVQSPLLSPVAPTSTAKSTSIARPLNIKSRKTKIFFTDHDHKLANSIPTSPSCSVQIYCVRKEEFDRNIKKDSLENEYKISAISKGYGSAHPLHT